MLSDGKIDFQSSITCTLSKCHQSQLNSSVFSKSKASRKVITDRHHSNYTSANSLAPVIRLLIIGMVILYMVVGNYFLWNVLI